MKEIAGAVEALRQEAPVAASERDGERLRSVAAEGPGAVV